MTRQTILGVDPGISGAMALIEFGHGYTFLDAADMPVIDVGVTTRISQIDETLLAAIVREWSPTIVILERVQPSMTNKPRHGAKFGTDHDKQNGQSAESMGVMGAFRYGDTVGTIRTTLKLCGHDPVFVMPAVWKRAAGLIGPAGGGESATKRKARSLAMARELWPEAPFERVKDHNRAEAALIARFGVSSQARLV